MKWLRTMVLFDKGNIAATADWCRIHESFVRSIEAVDFPEKSLALTLRRKQQRPDKQWDRNGVVYLKRRFYGHMVNDEKWQSEAGFRLKKQDAATEVTLFPSGAAHLEPVTSSYGAFDFVTTGPSGLHVAIEWETGNISSSHRSMNKLAIAVKTGQVDVGVTVVPSKDLYDHLTDRIGNISELSGYLSMWKGMGESVVRGMLAVAVVEHDALCDDGDYLPVGNDGRAAQGRARRKKAKGRAPRKKT